MSRDTAARERPALQAEAARAGQPLLGCARPSQRARACTSSKARLGSLDVMTGRLLRRLRRLPVPSIVVKLPGSSSPARPRRTRARAVPPTPAAGRACRALAAGAPAHPQARTPLHEQVGGAERVALCRLHSCAAGAHGGPPHDSRRSEHVRTSQHARWHSRPAGAHGDPPAAPRGRSMRGGGRGGRTGRADWQEARPRALAHRRASAPGAPRRAPAAPGRCRVW